MPNNQQQTNTEASGQQNINMLLESLFSMFGQNHNRRGSTASDTSSSSNAFANPMGNTVQTNVPNSSSVINNNNTTNTIPGTNTYNPSNPSQTTNIPTNPFLNFNRNLAPLTSNNQAGSSVISSRSNRSAGTLNQSANNINNNNNNNANFCVSASQKQMKEKETQTDMPINLLSFNKDNK
jgi:hypothetical protein